MTKDTTKSIKKSSPATPKKPRKKILTLDKVLKEAQQIDEWSEYVVDEKENYIIKYNKVFSETKINDLLTEFYQHILVDQEQGTNHLVTYADGIEYINFLIIKYFTNFGESMSDDLNENIKVKEFLKKHKLFLELQEFMFEPEQITRVFERFNQTFENGEKLAKLEKEELEKLLEQVQTPFYKEKLEKQYENVLSKPLVN